MVREGVGESVTAKRRMITLQACKEGRERGTEREVEECILVLVNSMSDDDKCVTDEDDTGLQSCIIPVKIINDWLLLIIITCISNVNIICSIITKSVRYLY